MEAHGAPGAPALAVPPPAHPAASWSRRLIPQATSLGHPQVTLEMTVFDLKLFQLRFLVPFVLVPELFGTL